MAEYKTADKLPILEEVTETTYALVEDGGSLKRVSGELLGGKSNCCVISVDYSNAQMEGDVESTNPQGVVYTCNMTYDELLQAIQSKTLNGFHVYEYDPEVIRMTYASKIYLGDNYLNIRYDSYYGSGNIDFNSDNTFTESGPL